MAREPRTPRRRMTSTERREQLIGIGRALFAEKGVDATTVEEIAARAEVSKPVVYEHFGGKEGLYAVVVDRETLRLLHAIQDSLSTGASSRATLERAALALLDYIDEHTDGFRILVRDAPLGTGSGAGSGSYSSILSDIASQVEHLLAEAFAHNGLDPKTAPMYAQMLVGMIAFTGQWWLETHKPRKPEVAAHLVNLAWNGLHNLEAKPR